ncbi:MAG: hypothetical protein ACI8PZ_006885 [Myxococcota bacterium]|jgi:hypothetical protein
MNKPTRDDFPPGRDGFIAWRQALGEDVGVAKGPWDPAKWQGATPAAVLGKLAAAASGPGRYATGGRVAEVVQTEAKPPLRAQWVTDLEGATVLNRLARLVHPMELQRVVPAVARGEMVQLQPLRPGSPFAPDAAGRVGMTLQPGSIGGRWVATVGGDSASGPRVDLVQLFTLYADVTLAPFAGSPTAPDWVATLTAGRTQLARELGDAILRRADAR